MDEDRSRASSDEDEDKDFSSAFVHCYIFLLYLSSCLIGFIDNKEPFVNNSNLRLYAPSTMPDEEEEAFEAFLARIDERVQSQSESSRRRRLRTNNDDSEVLTDTLARLPSTDDYPL